MEDFKLKEAQRTAKSILKAWTTIHADAQTKLIARAIDAALDVVLVEWDQWINAVNNGGNSYIETSADFVAETLKAEDMTPIAQAAWDNANATLVTIIAKRWNGPVLANFLNALAHTSDELRQEMVVATKRKAEEERNPPKPAKRPKLRRRPRKVVTSDNDAEE